MKDKYKLIEITFKLWTLCGYVYTKHFYINGKRVQEIDEETELKGLSEFYSLNFWLNRGDYHISPTTKNDRNRNGVEREYYIVEYKRK